LGSSGLREREDRARHEKPECQARSVHIAPTDRIAVRATPTRRTLA